MDEEELFFAALRGMGRDDGDEREDGTIIGKVEHGAAGGALGRIRAAKNLIEKNNRTRKPRKPSRPHVLNEIQNRLGEAEPVQVEGRKIYEDNMWEVVELEPSVRVIRFERLKDRSIALPYVQIHRKKAGGGAICVSFTNEPVEDYGTAELFFPPLPNTNDDRGGICNTHPGGNIQETIANLFGGRWTTGYTGDKMLKRTNDLPVSYADWEKKTKADPNFVTQIDWPTTVVPEAQRIVRQKLHEEELRKAPKKATKKKAAKKRVPKKKVPKGVKLLLDRDGNKAEIIQRFEEAKVRMLNVNPEHFEEEATEEQLRWQKYKADTAEREEREEQEEQAAAKERRAANIKANRERIVKEREEQATVAAGIYNAKERAKEAERIRQEVEKEKAKAKKPGRTKYKLKTDDDGLLQKIRAIKLELLKGGINPDEGIKVLESLEDLEQSIKERRDW